MKIMSRQSSAMSPIKTSQWSQQDFTQTGISHVESKCVHLLLFIPCVWMVHESIYLSFQL